MRRLTTQYSLWIILVSVSSVFGVSCKKDKVPVSIPEPTKWELIAGTYKVYDTLGTYLYDLNISHIPHPENETIDSLRFENFDGEFAFTAIQTNASNYLMSVRIGGHDTLYDSSHKRWKLSGALFDDYNKFENDTIRLRFQKTNINYWVEDAVPYYICDCKQIAVKQH
jgi:hypothetical protein